MKFFICNKCKIALKPTVHYCTYILLYYIKYCIPCRHRLLGQTTKLLLNKSEAQKPWKFKQLWGLWPDPNYLLKRISVILLILRVKYCTLKYLSRFM